MTYNYSHYLYSSYLSLFTSTNQKSYLWAESCTEYQASSLAILNHSCIQDTAGNGQQAFVYYNRGCAYANGCYVSAEGLDMLALVELLLVGDDPN
jgi:hypothetical protein